MLDALAPVLAPVLGWTGTIGTLAAYALMARGKVHARSLGYLVLNAGGGIVGAAGSVLYAAWPSVASNVVWASFAVHGLVTVLRARRRVEAELPTTDVVVPDDTRSLEIITPEAAEAARRA